MGQQLLYFGRRQFLGQQLFRQLDLRGLDPLETFRRITAAEPLDLPQQGRRYGGEGLVQQQHAGEAAIAINNRQLSESVPAHRRYRPIKIIAAGDREHRGGHHRLDRDFRRDPEGDPPHDVAGGDDADRPTAGIDDKDARRNARAGGADRRDGLFARPAGANGQCRTKRAADVTDQQAEDGGS